MPSIDVAGSLDELVDGPVVDRHADDRAVQQTPPLEPVQRPERHHLGQVAGDPEDHEYVGNRLRIGSGLGLLEPFLQYSIIAATSASSWSSVHRPGSVADAAADTDQTLTPTGPPTSAAVLTRWG